MSRSGEEWTEKTGGLSPGETPDILPAKAKLIEDLTQRLVSGELSPDEVEATHERILELKGMSLDDDQADEDDD